ncbi:hypothetical protein D0817_00430 [Flavobacterium cupreum]|uniref:Uncharacterized protein n=1 Tax=Flavobacterium cupreum TaxID=2133766 RepID=A0A434ACN8_9FLAO|nr:hypothetical protein D0817_00430 [Flavobacterium cupreum]
MEDYVYGRPSRAAKYRRVFHFIFDVSILLLKASDHQKRAIRLFFRPYRRKLASKNTKKTS